MKKRIILLIIVLFTNIIAIAITPAINKTILKNNLLIVTNPIPGKETETDEFVLTEEDKIIQKKIEKSFNNTYLSPYGEYITKKSIKVGVNPYLIASIIMENSNCDFECKKITLSCNNVSDLKGGESCLGGRYKKYETINESIDDLINYIYNTYTLKKVTDPMNMTQYKKDISWVRGVKDRMEQYKQD